MSQTSLTQGDVKGALIRFALPFLGASLLQFLYGAVDLIVVGQFDDQAGITAVSTGSQVMQAVTNFIIGLSTGGTVLVGQYLGAGRRGDVSRSIGTLFTLFAAIAVALALVFALSTNAIVALMQVPAEAVAPARQYLFICACGLVFITGYNMVSAVLRGLGDSRRPMYFVLVACVINIVGDLLLVGVFGLGAAGAAVATLISRVFEVVVVLGCMLWGRRLPVKPGLMVRPGRIIAGDFIRYSLPVVLNEGMWSLAMSLFSIIMGHMPNSTPILAAYTIAGNIDRMAAVALFAAGNTAAVIIGREIGCGDTEEVYGKGVALNFVCFLTGVVSMGILLVIRATLLDSFIFPLMDISAEAGDMAKMMLAFIAAIMPLRSLNLCNIVGVFRGGGDVRYALVCDVGPLYCICLPAAALCGLVFGLGIVAVYICISLDEVCKVFLCLPRLRSGKWVNSVTRENL